MEVTINYNGQAVAVEITLEVYEFFDRADHKTENLFHEQRRHWDGRESDEYIITTEGVGAYGETPEEYLCRMETLHELMAVLPVALAHATPAQARRVHAYYIAGIKQILENKQRNEERRVRTRRLIERGAVLEGIFPLAPNLSGAEVKAFLITLSHLPGAAELTANLSKSGDTP